MDLDVNVSSLSIFTYPEAALEDPASAPSPSKTVSTWLGASGQQATMFVVNIQFKVPMKSKPPDRITSLSVTLSSSENMNFPSGHWESNAPFFDKLKVEAAAGLPITEGGNYNWDVPLLIPCTIAPYERGQFARNYWRLAVKMQLPGLLIKKTLSAEKNLDVVSAPLGEPYNYSHTHTGFADALGPVQLSFITRSLNVGGYLRGAVYLPAPSPDLKLHSVHMSLIQCVTLHSRQKDLVERCPYQRFDFFWLRGESLQSEVCHSGAFVKPMPTSDGAILLEFTTRLPNDNHARPTTIRGSDAHIKLSHQLEFAMLYDEDGQNPVTDEKGSLLRKRYRVTWPVTLSNCAMRWRSLVLPEYSTVDQQPMTPRSERRYRKRSEFHADQQDCICGESLADLIRWEDEAEANSQSSMAQLLRQQLFSQPTQSFGGASSGARNRPRGRQRRPRRPGGDGVAGEEGSTGSEPAAASGERTLRSRTPLGMFSRSGSRSPAALRTPSRAISRAVTPDRTSIDFDHEGDHDEDYDDVAMFSSNDTATQQPWDDEEDEELMDKLERERQKREQLYTTQQQHNAEPSGSGAARR